MGINQVNQYTHVKRDRNPKKRILNLPSSHSLIIFLMYNLVDVQL
jgi:hypothetical protein